MNKVLSLVILSILTASSCSIYHISSEHVTEEFYPEQTEYKVVYLETIEEPHKIIGTVTVNAERRQQFSNVLVKMKREAGILGGHVITNIQSDATGAWKQLPVQEIIGNAYVRANFTASVALLSDPTHLEKVEQSTEPESEYEETEWTNTEEE